MRKRCIGSKMDELLVLTFLSLLIFHSALALSVSAETNPPVLRPGTTGQIILYITGSAENMDVYIDSNPLSIEGEGEWTDAGDVLSGTVTLALGLSVPSDLKPGTYYIPVEIRYESGGKTYEEHFEIPLKVEGASPLSVDLPDSVTGGRINRVGITIRAGAPVYNAYIYVADALKYPIFVGDVGGERSVDVEILPECRNGLYTFEVNVVHADGTDTFAKTVKCVEAGDLDVRFSLPRYIETGEHNGEIIIVNNGDKAKGPVYVTITGENATIGGKTTYTFEHIDGGATVHIPIVFYVKGGDTAAINVTLREGNAEKTYTFSAIVTAEPDILVYVAGPPSITSKGIEVPIGVANAGEGEADNVSLVVESNAAVDGGVEFVGDLAAGDYDTVTVVLSKPVEHIPVSVTYYVRGEKRTQRAELVVRYPEIGGNPLWIIAILILAGIGVYVWRKRR